MEILGGRENKSKKGFKEKTAFGTVHEDKTDLNVSNTVNGRTVKSKRGRDKGKQLSGITVLKLPIKTKVA